MDILASIGNWLIHIFYGIWEFIKGVPGFIYDVVAKVDSILGTTLMLTIFTICFVTVVAMIATRKGIE